jgi:hypothetical protein
MNIILGKENIGIIDDRYLILELDTVLIKGAADPITAYCLVENLALDEVARMNQQLDLHQHLIRNYKLQNWNFCTQAIEHLRGHWNRELDSFYDALQDRIKTFKQTPPGPDWTGVVDMSRSSVTALA